MKHTLMILSFLLFQNFCWSQNVGIGTTAPSAQLDISGSLRYRGNGYPNIPRVGAVLTAVDETGNAEWQRPVVFKTRGLPAQQTISKGTWTKIIFKNNDMELNEGLAFDPFTSTFNAPVKGAYHFDAQVLARLSSAWTSVRVVVERNGGIIKDFRTRHDICEICDDSYDNAQEILKKIQVRAFNISTMVYLEKYDKVWLEVSYSSNDNFMYVKPAANETWFNGALLYRL